MKLLFSERLRNLRIDANLTQSQLADILNTTQRRISYFEMDKVEPDLTTLCSIAKFFDVTTDYLLGITDY